MPGKVLKVLQDLHFGDFSIGRNIDPFANTAMSCNSSGALNAAGELNEIPVSLWLIAASDARIDPRPANKKKKKGAPPPPLSGIRWQFFIKFNWAFGPRLLVSK